MANYGGNIFAGILENLGKVMGQAGMMNIESKAKEAARQQGITDKKDLIAYELGEKSKYKQPNQSLSNWQIKNRYQNIKDRFQNDPNSVTDDELKWAEQFE